MSTEDVALFAGDITMAMNTYPRLTFSIDFDERAEHEANARGWLSYAKVELSATRQCPIVFYDIVRLEQELASDESIGRPYIAEPGMIVLREITKANMENAVTRLYEAGFFDSFR